MKGRPKQEVARRARQAIRDVLFLFHLHQQVNRKFMEEDRHYWTRALLLSVEWMPCAGSVPCGTR